MSAEVELLIVSDHNAIYPYTDTLTSIRKLVSNVLFNLCKLYSDVNIFKPRLIFRYCCFERLSDFLFPVSIFEDLIKL